MINKKLQKIFEILTDPSHRFESLAMRGWYNNLSDEEYIKRIYNLKFENPLNLDNPKTFNEKLQWLKLYDRKPIYNVMVDKFDVKKFVADRIGEEYVIPTLGVWNSFDDIDFSSLPNQFVLKCTHDSGGLVICKNKNVLDLRKARNKLNKSLKKNYYYVGREWPYKDVKPRIIAEKYMEDHSTSELRDYKFFCFGGRAKCYKVDFDRFVEHRANYFSTDGELMKIGEEICPPDFNKEIPVPENLEKMKEFAEKLSATQPFLRADFYDVDGHVYFGELTFYPASGFGKFIYDGNDELLGSWIKLPEKSDVWGGYYLIYRDMLCVLNTHALNPKKDESKETQPIRDYKIYTFNGEAKMCMINQDRGHHTRADYFDKNYKWLDFTWGYEHADVPPEKPKNYEKMFELAEKLAAGTPELRVDFYEVDGRIYFGELTFFDGSGFDKMEPKCFDELLGSWIKLPRDNMD